MLNFLLRALVISSCLCIVANAYAGAATEVYQYDELGRLSKVIDDGRTKASYCYDAAGNRTSQRETDTTCPIVSSPSDVPSSSSGSGSSSSGSTSSSGGSAPAPCIAGQVITVHPPTCDGSKDCMESFARNCDAAGGESSTWDNNMRTYICKRVCN